jgi:hypothetical protein
MGEKLRQSDISEQDLFGLVIKSAKELRTVFDGLDEKVNKVAGDLAKMANASSTETQKGINKLIAAEKGMNAQFKKTQAIEKEKIAASKSLQKARLDEIRIQKAREKSIDDFNKKEAIAIRQAERQTKATLDSANAYKQLTSKVNAAQAEFKRLAAQHGVNSSQARKARATFNTLDKELRSVNNAARDGRRDVGRYGLALQNARGSALRLASGLGLAVGGFAAFRKGFEVLSEFDEKLADIQKTTGLTKSQASGLSQDLFNIDTKTPITNLQELVEAGGRLNIQGVDNLKAFAQSADKVFVALGDDLEGTADEIATTLGKIASNTGLEKKFGTAEGIERIGSAINDLSAKSKAQGAPIVDFLNRMAGFGELIDPADLAALGAFFDEGGQSIEIASSTLAKLLPSLANDFEKFAKISGLPAKEFKKLAEDAPIEALKAVAKGAQNNEKGLFNLTEIVKSFGIESARATSIVGFLSNNTERLTELQGISGKALEENTSLTDEFNTKNDTLSATFAKATKKITEQIIAFNESTGAADGLKNAIVFLTDNMGTILSVMGKVIVLFVAYKTRLIAINIAQKLFNDGSGKMSINLKTVAKNFKNSASEGKGFGSILKGIGWAAAIAGAAAVAKGFYDIATGARQAAFDTEQLNKALTAGSKVADEFINKRKKERDDALALAKTDAERLRIQNEYNKSLRSGKDIALDDLRNEKKRLAVLQEIVDKSKEQGVDFLIEQADAYRDFFKAGDDLGDLLGKSKAKVQGYQTVVDALGGALTDASQEQKVFNKDLADSSAAVDGAKESTEKQISLLREIQDEKLKQIADEEVLEKTTAQLEASRRREDVQLQKATEEEKAALIIEININLRLQLAAIDKQYRDAEKEAERIHQEELAAARLAAEEKAAADALVFQQNILKLKRLELLKSDATEEEIAEQSLRNEIELLELKTTLTLDELITLEEKKRQLRQQEEDEVKEHQKKLRDIISEFGDDAIDRAIENSKKRQSLIDDEITKSKSLEDALRESANNQNATAKESLAAQESITEQKTRDKQKEAKKEALLEEVKAIWNALNGFLDQGDKLPVATGKAFAGVLGVKQLVNSLSGFFKGTKGKLKDEHTPFMSGKDGHIIRADGNEMIFNGGQVDQLAAAGINTTDDAVKSAIMNQQLQGVTMAYNVNNGSGFASTEALERKVDELTKVMSGKPSQMISPVFIKGALAGAVEERTKGSLTERFHYIVKG